MNVVECLKRTNPIVRTEKGGLLVGGRVTWKLVDGSEIRHVIEQCNKCDLYVSNSQSRALLTFLYNHQSFYSLQTENLNLLTFGP
jgi:hypothetical protein